MWELGCEPRPGSFPRHSAASSQAPQDTVTTGGGALPRAPGSWGCSRGPLPTPASWPVSGLGRPHQDIAPHLRREGMLQSCGGRCWWGWGHPLAYIGLAEKFVGQLNRCITSILHLHTVFLPRKSHGWRSLVGYSPWARKELDMTKRLHSLAKLTPKEATTLKTLHTNIGYLII